MLFWQHKNTHKRIILWAKLIGLSSGIHCILLLWFFFFCKDQSSRLSFVVTPDLFNREIEFTIAQKPSIKKSPAGKSTGSVSQKGARSAAPRKKAVKQTTIAKKTSPAKKSATKPATPKKATPVKKETAKPVEKPVAASDTKETAEKKATPDVKPPSPSTNNDTSNEQGGYQLDVYQIGVHERALLEEFKVLHEEIVSHWAPPPGLASDCSCQITMQINWEGVVQSYTVNESSGVLMYDASARKALSMIKIPRWAWGKELTITFNQ